MSTTLTLSRVDVAYGARTLVHGLDLVVAPGGVTALVGPNGSGKSSLMRTIVGELPVEAGSIRLAPTDATIGWLPQSPPDPDESLLGYARRRTGVAEADRALDERFRRARAREGPGRRPATPCALEHWLALGGADLEDRLPQVAGPARARRRTRTVRSAPCPAARRPAPPSPRSCSAATRCCCSTSRPTTWTRRAGADGRLRDRHEGPVMVASHDRDFLDRVATEVVELDLAQQHDRPLLRQLVSDLRRRPRARAPAGARGLRGVRRDARPAPRPGQAARRLGREGRRNVKRSDEPDKNIREKYRARADRQAAKAARAAAVGGPARGGAQPRKEWELRYTIDPGAESAEVVWTLDRLVLSSRRASSSVRSTSPSRAATGCSLAGANGTGKTTLLAAMLGALPPASGRVSLGSRVRLGVIDQERSLLSSDRSVVDVVRARARGPVDGGGGAHAAGQVRARCRARRPARPQPVAGRAHPRADGAVPGARGQRARARRADQPSRRTRDRAAGVGPRRHTPGRSSSSAMTRRSWSGSGSTRCSTSPEPGGQSQRGSTGRRRWRLAAITPPTAPPRWACHETSCVGGEHSPQQAAVEEEHHHAERDLARALACRSRGDEVGQPAEDDAAGAERHRARRRDQPDRGAGDHDDPRA